LSRCNSASSSLGGEAGSAALTAPESASIAKHRIQREPAAMGATQSRSLRFAKLGNQQIRRHCGADYAGEANAAQGAGRVTRRSQGKPDLADPRCDSARES
jgi:hypothetical protein